MMKNDIPILEFDPTAEAMFGYKVNVKLPPKAVFGILGDCIEEYAESCGARTADIIHTITKDYPIYILNYNGEDICLLQSPMGAPAAVQNMEILLHNGVKHIISAGSCGVLREMPENHFLVPVRALRDEGCSYHYLEPSRYAELNMPMTKQICRYLENKGISYEKCITWTTDGLFRETADKVSARREEGCDAVEMECASLAACAKFRNADFGMLLFTADSLADIDTYDRRDFGNASLVPALKLCLDIITYRI